MRRREWGAKILWICGLAGISLIQCGRIAAQNAGSEESRPSQGTLQVAGPAQTSQLIQEMQAQLQELSRQVKELKTQQQSASAESAELRKELATMKAQLSAALVQPLAPGGGYEAGLSPERVARLEENQQLADQKAAEQSQTKVESASKYRARLSGIVLFNMFANRGSVDNLDFPQIATPPEPLGSSNSFGATLRQSQIGFEGFGPTIAGARTSADIRFDFSGGFPDAENGVSFGIVRLRTGVVRFDWENTSVIAGQDALFLAPLSPTSLATLGVPGFAYSGNLWAWTPQVRVEHRFEISEKTSLLWQGGILDSLSGDTPAYQFYRTPTWGEASGQPAYATRIAWSRSMNGQKLIAGAGGYYARQDWGLNRSVDSWAGTADLTLPITSQFMFAGQFYRGRAVGGLGGGIGQTAVWIGSLRDPATEVYGLDSMGGWAQLKYQATSKLQFNGGYGQDAPFAGEMRQFGGSQNYYPSPLSKNWSVLGNFLYQPKSDIVFSMEYRRLKTYTLDANANAANIFSLSIGYLF